jgi:hypothetical protein
LEVRVRFEQLLSDSGTTPEMLAEFLDGLDHQGRMAVMDATSKAQQRKLWSLVETAPPIAMEHFVPESVDAGVEVIHHGRNTLPVLRSFQKRFVRSTGGDDEGLYGYNEGLTRAFLGPGYFVAHPTTGNADWAARGAVVVDYFMVPQGPVPAQWPVVKPNSSGLQVLVYHKTRDFMRRVSQHVSIGMAFKVEKSLNNWFTLVREDHEVR